jgi:hypothetical protein
MCCIILGFNFILQIGELSPTDPIGRSEWCFGLLFKRERTENCSSSAESMEPTLAYLPPSKPDKLLSL